MPPAYPRRTIASLWVAACPMAWLAAPMWPLASPASAQSITEVSLPTPFGAPERITAGSGGAGWVLPICYRRYL